MSGSERVGRSRRRAKPPALLVALGALSLLGCTTLGLESRPTERTMDRGTGVTASLATAPEPSVSVSVSPPIAPTAMPSPTSSPPIDQSPGPVAYPQVVPGASVRLEFEAVAGPRVNAGDRSGAGSLEPVIATHPSDPSILALAYGRATKGATGVAGIAASVRISKDGGLTWHETKRQPCDGSGRRPSLHSAVAFGPGPSGAGRLYWTGTTTAGTGGVRVATAYSDDLGATWSRLHVVRDTPAWVGGFPDITVDRDPASPGYGIVYIAYNFPEANGHGAGIRLLASSDLGRSWHGVNVRQASADRRYPVSWRFGSRVRAAPDGTVYVSTYQADLRSWDPADVFDRGGPANVGRVGFAVTRLSFDRGSGHFSASPTVMATTIGRNAYTTSRRVAPGTRSHTYLDPMWSHGLDVDPVSGSVFLAIADVSARPAAGHPRGAVRLGRSDDAGRTWTWTTLPQAPSIHGLRQSSFKPTLVVRGPVVFVGLHTIDDVAAGAAWSADARIGNAYAVSVDGGLTFTTPKLVSSDRWRAAALERAINGPGLRDRAELTADGRIVYAYGDARIAAAKPARSAGPRQLYVALISVELP